MNDYYDALETRTPEQREQDLMAKLARQLAHAKEKSNYYKGLLAPVDPAAITSRAVLAKLPLTRKRDLIELQKGNPPFGGCLLYTSKSAPARGSEQRHQD